MSVARSVLRRGSSPAGPDAVSDWSGSAADASGAYPAAAASSPGSDSKNEGDAEHGAQRLFRTENFVLKDEKYYWTVTVIPKDAASTFSR